MIAEELIDEGPRHGMTEDEVAAQLSWEEGRRVSVAEVRRIFQFALRKARRVLAERGLRLDDVIQ